MVMMSAFMIARYIYVYIVWNRNQLHPMRPLILPDIVVESRRWMPWAPLFTCCCSRYLDGIISPISIYIDTYIYVRICSLSISLSCRPANLSVSPAAEPLVLCRRRCLLPTASSAHAAPPHAAQQLQLRWGAKLLQTNVSGAIDASTDATATAGPAIGAAVALQPQLSAAIAPLASSCCRLRLWSPQSIPSGHLLCHLYAATHPEQQQQRQRQRQRQHVCLHLQLGGSHVWATSRSWTRTLIDATGTQDAAAAHTVRCGQTVSRKRERERERTLPNPQPFLPPYSKRLTSTGEDEREYQSDHETSWDEFDDRYDNFTAGRERLQEFSGRIPPRKKKTNNAGSGSGSSSSIGNPNPSEGANSNESSGCGKQREQRERAEQKVSD